MEYGVIAFSSTHCAIMTERHLRGLFPIQMMPSLRSLAATCGISIRFRPCDLTDVRAAVATLGMANTDYQIYLVRPNGEIVAGDAGDAGDAGVTGK